MKNFEYLEINETDLGYLEIYERTKKYFKQTGVYRRSEHRLRIGIPDEYYIDFDMIVNDLLQMKDVIFLYKNEIENIERQHQIDFLSFIEKSSGGTIGAIRLAGAISLETGIPNIPIRLTKIIPFEKVKIPARLGKSAGSNKLESLNSTLILDHCTSGDEALTAAEVISKNGGKITDLITYTMRTDKFRWNKFKDDEIRVHYIHDVSPDGVRNLGLKIKD